MERYDYNLPYMLQYEHVAWYEEGEVKILDRRIYPKEVSYVNCKSYMDVRQAIKDMVTQSAGPYTAAGMGMALAAYQARNLEDDDKIEFLKNASEQIATARPTTANRMRKITENSLYIGIKAIKEKKNPAEAIKNDTIKSLNRRYSTMKIVAKNLCSLIKDGDKILTQCFGETIIGMMLRILKEEEKNVSFYCAETRPYYQGARLTATCCSEMGFETTIVTDNAIAYLMENIGIDLFTSAADTITRDGNVANKIGTYQIAILSKHFNIPYYVTGIPDDDKYTREDITIEMRDPNLVLEGRTAKNVKALYPSFDITGKEFIDKIVTDKGNYDPENLHTYFDSETKRFY
ncbi:s-methyl-5-thioribose-1-phosphate isomerase [Anaerococcus sp. AGMB00486]|uniref:S-methyl-5-thioribose-1-phosphate isomerase n=1 Tax=Anaerococcus faecalis TaxID=2742993 RepID=A0ABX2NCF6_9FIRM|nr:s-methyl-5-thioribose-1-phosphate isomerase [Anaerococcus faecalis]NVF12378.1 s-methyl-5-thioribose-1-phosphate isomerase [Anaerococcus faecalis]